jgi:Glutathione S-transferase N-terminal domain
MLTLYSYPTLFGVADNNGYGLKVFAFLKLAAVPFVHEHIFDASKAPRGQLPYIVDGSDIVGDSETIIAYVTKKYAVALDAQLAPAQRTTNLLITRMLDDLYWVMSYSRWKDERYWHLFRDALLREHPNLTVEGLAKAKEFNAQRYYYQGIGPLRSRCCHGAWARRPRRDRRTDSTARFCTWRKADQHRRRDLWLHRQHAFL